MQQLAVGRQLDLVGRRAHEISRHCLSFSKSPQVSYRLEDGEVLLELPVRQLDAVVVPLASLQLDVAVEDVRSEGLSRQVRLGQRVDRLAQGLRERDDAPLLPLLRGQVIEVRLQDRKSVVPLL